MFIFNYYEKIVFMESDFLLARLVGHNIEGAGFI